MFFRLDYSLRNTIFLRLLVTFLLIMLPIQAFAVYLYHWNVQTASSDITKTATAQAAFYLNDLENEIERMKLLQYSLLEDDNLNELVLAWEAMATISRTENMNALIKRLYTVQNSSNYIKNVSVHIEVIGRTISADDGVREFRADRYQEIRSVFGGGSQLIEWNGGLFLSAMKQRGIKGLEPLFTVEIELDKQRLREALAQFNTYAGSGTLLLSDSAEVAIANGTGELANVSTPVYLPLIQSLTGSNTRLTINENGYYTVQAHSSVLGLSIYRFIPEEVVQKPLSTFYKWAWVFAVAALGILAAFALSTYKFIHKPMLTLVKSFRRMEQGDLNISIAHESRDEFRYLYGRFNQMVDNLRSLIDQAYKQKIMAQRAELKQLQSQINPHFLYNSFFILNTMAKTGDTERIEQFTTLLGEYFEFVTRNGSDLVALEQEIHHARMYAEIQELRFSRRIQVQFAPLPDELRSIQVPRLIVQPIIENAFKHSLEKKVRNGLITVQFGMSDNGFCIIIEDNGERLTDEALAEIRKALHTSQELQEITGMVNIHRRIHIMFGEGSGLRAERSELGGLKVTIIFADGGELSNVQDANR